MAITAGLVFLFSAIPVVLTASTALLLDIVFKYEKTYNRCQIQVLMWLLLSVTSSMGWSGPSESGNKNISESESESSGSGIEPQVVCFVWAHLTIFLNLMVLIAEVVIHRLVSMSRRKRNVRNVLQILPKSSCWTTIVVVCYVLYLHTAKTASEATSMIEKTWIFSLYMFVGSVLVLWLIRYSANRQRKVMIDMQGMPTTVTTAASGPNNSGGIMARFCGVMTAPGTLNHKSTRQFNENCWLDERQWYRWSRAQTMQWFAQQFSLMEDSDTSIDDKEMIVSILTPHRITGDVLDGLVDISQLIALRVPFGPACRLSDSIAEMVERYPKPCRNNVAKRWSGRNNNERRLREESQSNSHVPTLNDSLDLHDHEYNCKTRQINQERKGAKNGMQTPYPPTPLPDSEVQHRYSSGPTNESGMSEEQHEKLNNVMKERFGLELPKLKATDFLAVQKGLSNKANNTNTTIPSTNESEPLSHPFGGAAIAGNIDSPARSDYGNGTTGPIQQKSIQDQRLLSSTFDDKDNLLLPSSTGIPEHILDGMPSEIRKIAKRRPDLIQTIWKQKQQQVQNQSREPSISSASSALPAAATRNTQLPSISESAANQFMRGEVRVDAGDSDFDSDDEDETTCLIHRDNTNEIPARYKSISKPTVPSII